MDMGKIRLIRSEKALAFFIGSVIFCFFYSCKSQISAEPLQMDGFKKSEIYEVEIYGMAVFVGSESFFGNRVFETAQCNISKDISVVVRKKSKIVNYRIRPLSKNM